MNLRSVFDVFSRRPRAAAPARLKPLTAEFRTRVLMVCRDRFGTPAAYAIAPSHMDQFLAEMHGRLTYLVGRPRLSNSRGSQGDDLIQFLTESSDEHFLDFVESIFRLDCYRQACPDEQTMVDEINHLLDLDGLPYAITAFAYETGTGHFMGHAVDGVRRTVAYPQVILREHQIPHAEAVAPALALLADVGFSSANEEFRGALEDYRRGRYGECLTKCGSAFESTMKLICDRHRWPYGATDAAAALLDVVVTNSGMEPFFKQPLLIIATLRNRFGTVHGAGAQPREVPPHRAQFAINATAGAILLLVEECR